MRPFNMLLEKGRAPTPSPEYRDKSGTGVVAWTFQLMRVPAPMSLLPEEPLPSRLIEDFIGPAVKRLQ